MVNRSIEQYSIKVNIEGWDSNRQAIYKYMLLECEKKIEFDNQTVKLPCFGVEIIREYIGDDNACKVERDNIECITTYKYKAVQLLKKLYENCVSPIHLVDIAGSMADDWTSDFDEQLSAIAAQ